MEWIETITKWLVDLVKAIFGALWDMLTDLVIELADLVLQAVAALIEAIPAPGFLEAHSLGGLLGGMGSDMAYFVGALNIPEGLAMLGAAFGVRMIRKAVTLFQW